MGIDCGVAGVYGILLEGKKSAASILGAEAVKELLALLETAGDDAGYMDEADTSAADEKMRAELLRVGIVAPEGCHFSYTGSWDERPGRTDTPAESWVYGIGLLTDPWAWPVIDETFRKAAAWWTWAWAG